MNSPAMYDVQATREARRPFVSFFIVLLIIIAIGFAGYYFGFLEFIYRVMMPEVLGNFSLVALSIIFGTAAFFPFLK